MTTPLADRGVTAVGHLLLDEEVVVCGDSFDMRDERRRLLQIPVAHGRRW